MRTDTEYVVHERVVAAWARETLAVVPTGPELERPDAGFEPDGGEDGATCGMLDAPDGAEEFVLVAGEVGDGETMATGDVVAGLAAEAVGADGGEEPMPDVVAVAADDDTPAVPADADPELAVANGSRELWEM